MCVCVPFSAGALRVKADGQIHQKGHGFRKKTFFAFPLCSFILTIHQAAFTAGLPHGWRYNRLIFTDLDEWGVKEAQKNERLEETTEKET